MRIEVIVCDVCGHRWPGEVQRFAARVDGKQREWDVGGCCLLKPFRICEPRHVDVVITVGPAS